MKRSKNKNGLYVIHSADCKHLFKVAEIKKCIPLISNSLNSGLFFAFH